MLWCLAHVGKSDVKIVCLLRNFRTIERDVERTFVLLENDKLGVRWKARDERNTTVCDSTCFEMYLAIGIEVERFWARHMAGPDFCRVQELEFQFVFTTS